VATAAAVLLLTLTACGGGGATESTGTLDRDATLRVTYVSLPPGLDPHATPSEVSQFPYVSLLYDRLTQMVHGANGAELAPMVATSWEFSPDGRQLTFRLRDDATFSDGTKVDAAAVQKSLERALTLPKSTAKNFLSSISGVTAPDPATVVVAMSTPNADLPYILSTGYGSIISPKALEAPDLDVNPQGSGPYTASSVKVGESVTYERRPGYWDPEAGKAKTVVIRGIVDSNGRLSDIRSGQTDMTLLQTQQFSAAEALGDDFSIVTYDNTSTRQSTAINQFRPYMNDPRVRQALNYAVDRQSIVDAIMDGHAAPNNQPLAANQAGYLAQPDPSIGYDPERAKQLLAEAGVPQGHELNIIAGNYSPIQDIAKALQAQLTAVGFTVNVELTDVLGAISAYTKDSKYDLSVGVRIGYETPRLTLSNSYLSTRTLLNPAPPAFTEALGRAADPTTSDADRDRLLTDAETVAMDQSFDIYVAGERTTLLTTKDVVGADAMGRSDYQGIFDLRYVGKTG
jgi:peptide/nickel transport system substrate-binding protein